MRPEALDEILHRSTAFGSLSPEHYERLRPLLREEHFEFGDMIVKQGDEADSFYILTSGRARVVKETESGEEIALTTLRPGDEFGELALISGGNRNATVRCSTAVDVVRLDSRKFLPLLEEFPELKKAIETTARIRTLHGFLYEFSNFGRLSARALHAVVGSLTPVDFEKGDMIVREGDPAGPMYIVQTGRVRVFSGPDGCGRNLAFYRGGDFFGELSILNGSPRAASAEAVTRCHLLALEPQAVRELEEAYPEFRKLLAERLSRYRADEEARIPVDFNEEILPAEVRDHDKVRLDDAAAAAPAGDEPLDEESGVFRPGRAKIRSVPHVQQIDEMDCGAACLGMICRHFGRKVSLAHIRQLCHTALDGTSLKGICHAASELGLAARALKISPRNLPQMPLPAIIHWDGNHWMVLCQVDESGVRVNDPARGARHISRAEFETKWTGYVALFDYTEAFEQAPEGRSIAQWVAPFFRQQASTLGPAILLAGTVVSLQLLFPIFTQWVVDKVVVGHDIALLTTIMLAMGGALVFMQAASLAQHFLLSFAAVRIDSAILDFLARQMLSLPMSYFSSRRPGDIQRRLDGARQIRLFVVQHGIGGVLSLVTLFGAVVLMVFYNLALAGVFLATVPLYAGIMYFSVRLLRPLFADIEESHDRYTSYQTDAIKGIEAVKTGSAEPIFRNAMLNEFLGVSQKMLRANFLVTSSDSVVQTIGLLSTALFLWLGARQVISGQMTIGAFVAFNSLAAMACAAILRALGIWEQWQQGAVLLNRLSDVFEAEPEQGRDRSHLAPVHSLEGRIELRNVGFRYGGPEAPEILKEVTLDLAPGKTIAVVGRSGSGKTTLIKLLAGLIEPTAGAILIDHVDLKTLNYRDLRLQIGMVLQDNYIFSETVMRNIAIGDPDPDFDRVLWSSQTANAHDFIMRLPMGYESRIGDSGLGLSGGQKQRIAIARALYHNPPILIFDEATSALDTESERAIQENLRCMAAGRTCIVIAHRLSTIRDADMIVVLEKGEVAEIGTHDELMARRGLYFHLSSQQVGI